MKISKKYILFIFLLVFFCLLIYSCKKDNKTSEENNFEQLSEQKSNDNNEKKENEFSIDSREILPTIIKEKTLILPYDDSDTNPKMMTLLYNYDGYWSMRFGEYFSLEGKYYDEEGNRLPSQNLTPNLTPPEFKDLSNLYKNMEKNIYMNIEINN